MFSLHKYYNVGVCIIPKISKNVLIDDVENIIFIKSCVRVII